MRRVRIKFCGLTRAEDVLLAAELGVDALGFVMVPSSKRALSLDQAAALVKLTPVFVHSVGLFQNQTADEVRQAIATAKFSMLQFHGAEDNAFCASFGLPFVKAVPMADSPDLLTIACQFPQARALLLDAHSLAPANHHASGGTGKRFDWSLIPDPDGPMASPLPLVLAGGLQLANVADGITRVRPWAVDVSSGIESAAGIKDAQKMAAFVRAVNQAG